MSSGEHDHQAALIEAIHTIPGLLNNYPELDYLFAIPNGTYCNIVTAKRMKAEGLRKGVWDLFLPVVRDPWSGFFIEFKYGENKMSPEQHDFGVFAYNQGYLCMEARDWEQCLEVLKAYLDRKVLHFRDLWHYIPTRGG